MAHGIAMKYVAVGLLACVAATAQAASTDGSWHGVVREGSQAVRATLQRKGDIARVHFGEPRNCAASAEFLEEISGSLHFRFKPVFNGGGFCEGLYPGDLVLTASGQGTTVRFRRAGASWSGDLSAKANP